MTKQLAETPNVATVVFGATHYRAGKDAFERIGRCRHPAALNVGDCFSYAVATISKAPFLFKNTILWGQILNFILRLR
jgi:ribonuclease VapC